MFYMPQDWSYGSEPKPEPAKDTYIHLFCGATTTLNACELDRLKIIDQTTALCKWCGGYFRLVNADSKATFKWMDGEDVISTPEPIQPAPDYDGI
jgi:hypothetical protein